MLDPETWKKLGQDKYLDDKGVKGSTFAHTPVQSWNVCKPIAYSTINESNGSTYRWVVEKALSDMAYITGLKFVADGSPHVTPQNPLPVNTTPTMVFGWLQPDTSNLLPSDNTYYGGAAGRSSLTYGAVLYNVDRKLAAFGSNSQYSAVIKALAAALGLGSMESGDSIMSSNGASDYATLQAVDISGLRTLYGNQKC